MTVKKLKEYGFKKQYGNDGLIINDLYRKDKVGVKFLSHKGKSFWCLWISDTDDDYFYTTSISIENIRHLKMIYRALMKRTLIKNKGR